MTVTRWTRLGAVWLVGMGVLITTVVAYGFLTSRWACDPESGYSFACDASNIAVVISAAIAALHLLAGAGVWRGRVWGAVLGAAIAFLGLIGSAGLSAEGPWWLVLPACAGSLGTSLILAYALIAGRWGQSRDPIRS